MTITLRMFLAPALWGALSMPAAAGDVKVFAANGVDLSAYKTFRMLPTRVLTKHGVVENDPDISPFINAAIRKELAAKGLTEVSHGGDVEVSAGALTSASAQVEALIFNVTNDASWGTSPIATVGRYNKEGTLIINLIDPRTNKSIWLGLATRALGRPSAAEGHINKAAAALFKKYPAQAAR